jgi:hypothetical protein
MIIYVGSLTRGNNMSWILIMYIYAGAFAKGDSVSLLYVPGFRTQADCMAAGVSGSPLVANSMKEYRYVCLKQS